MIPKEIGREEEGEAAEVGERVRVFLSREVVDWDDPVKVHARFKGFSGQKSDWEGRYLFWRNLILKIARHLGTLTICPSHLNDIWFRREGLSPLCLHQVLFEMQKAGDIVRYSDLVEPNSTTAGGRSLSLIFKKAFGFFSQSASAPRDLDYLPEDDYVLSSVLKDKALEAVKILSESHWTSSCVITLRKFQEICGGSKEAAAISSHLSSCQKVKSLMITKNDIIKGFKVSLSEEAVSDITSLDCDVLQLIWTVENLEKQLEVIEQRCEKSKKLAQTQLRSGNKKLALRHAKELKLGFESREKCTMLLNRVEEVLRVIGDIESSKKVTDAIKLGAKAMRDNSVSIEEVELSLEDINSSIESLNQVEEALAGTTIDDDEDIEDELRMLEMELDGDSTHMPSVPSDVSSSVKVTEASETADSLLDSFSNLKIKSRPAPEAA